MRPTLFTIGYEGLVFDEFAALLQRHKVHCLIDVRELPMSRKRDYAKTRLSQLLATFDIAYRHYGLLGSPRALRQEVRATQDYARFFTGVRRHLNQSFQVTALQEVIEIATSTRSCLMCRCADWELCHRRCITNVLQAKLKIVHIDTSLGCRRQSA